MNRNLLYHHRFAACGGRRPRAGMRLALLLMPAVMIMLRSAIALEPEETPVPDGATVITSQRLEFDNRRRLAVFEKDVLVRDDTLRMRSDLLTVVFDEDEQPLRLEAEGNVMIRQENHLARSRSAAYDLPAGKMVLTGSAEVRRGNDLLKGETITFWRDQDRIEVRPGTLIISPATRGH